MMNADPNHISRPEVWQNAALVRTYLEDVRAGIPYGIDQIEIGLRVAASLRPRVTSILDLGCGDGIAGSAALSVWPNASLTLVDFSPPMLDAARKRLFGNRNIAFVERDFGSAGWIDSVSYRAPFDFIVSAYAIHHQEDQRKQELYHEIVSLLAPGGVFINMEHVRSSSSPIEAIWDRMLIEHLTHLHPERDLSVVERDYANRPDRAANRLAPVESQLVWLREAGLVDVDCFFKVLELAVFGGRKAIDED